MPLTQREYDFEELRVLERRLADIENPRRQDTPESFGHEYATELREETKRLRRRLSGEEEG